jgi:hypothetical protein
MDTHDAEHQALAFEEAIQFMADGFLSDDGTWGIFGREQYPGSSTEAGLLSVWRMDDLPAGDMADPVPATCAQVGVPLTEAEGNWLIPEVPYHRVRGH